jgi:cell fate (sporulation/competence/biofilm development) regulator YlbF (YheA/YmcA/DUF963 family)
MESTTLDMAAVLLKAYELGDMINRSQEVRDYLYWQQQTSQDPEIQRVMRLFQKKKEAFAECERFGRYHPDYNKALEELREVERQLNAFPAVKKYKEAEERLDDLLYAISKTVAHSVSPDIKVPRNKAPLSACGCGAGGCGGKCG